MKLETQLWALLMMKKFEDNDLFNAVINEYQEELKMSVDIYEFPHCFNISRRLLKKFKELRG